MNKTCLITGGAGFIGSHLCEKLIFSGYKVICVDNLLSGRIENIASFKNSPGFQFFNEDVNMQFSKQLDNLFASVDFIFHLASPASPNQKSQISYYAHPIETLLVNSLGTYKLLEYCLKTKAKFLFASTSEIYGDPLIHPQNESYFGNVNPIGVRSCYDEAKRFGEAITFAYHCKHQVNVRITRIFNTYGPRMHKDDGRAIVEFINRALKGEPMPIFGDGRQTRSFCYISDLVDGLFKSMFESKTNGEVINLGNPKEITIFEIAQIIKELTSSSSQFISQPLPSDDPKRRCPDISKAKKLLDWTPKVNLKEGLKKTIEFFKHYPQ